MDSQQIELVVRTVTQELLDRKMSLPLAKALIERVEEKASEKHLAVVIAIADEVAHPVAVHRMDGAYIASYDIAVNKAFTSAGFKMSTEQLGSLAQPGQPLYGIQHTNEGKIVIFGGGEPLTVNGSIIGAIGVSGGSAEEDTALAAYAKEICQEVAVCL